MIAVFDDIDGIPSRQTVNSLDAKDPVRTVTRQSSDRLILYAIWRRSRACPLSASQGWEELATRYPEEPRLLLMNAYETLSEAKASSWSPTAFICKLQKIVDRAGGRLNPEVRDLIAVADDDLHPLTTDEETQLTLLKARVSCRLSEPHSASKRLQRLGAALIRELHERSLQTTSSLMGFCVHLRVADARDWCKAIEAYGGPKPVYSAHVPVAIGDIVDHPKFGPGVVIAQEPGRAMFLFECGPRKLITA